MRMSRRDKMMLVEEMEMYISAGLPVSRALTVMKKRAPKRRASAFENIRRAVESGQSLSVAMADEIDLPASVIGLIGCGETTGSLSQALKTCQALLEEQDELIKKTLSSMAYPIMIGLATVGLTIGLVQGIMPQITPLLSGLHVSLPLITRVVMAVSGFLIDWGLLIVLGAVILNLSAFFAYKKASGVRRLVHICLIRMPIVGKLASHYSLTLFFQSFGAMTEAGMPADTAYEKAVAAISLIPLRARLEAFTQPIRGGEKFYIIAKDMPAYVESLISAGESSGNLGRSLCRAATMIGKELDHALKRLTAMVEPTMMLGMGSMVGSIALSIMMPIYDISKTLQR